jgi:hypothetical protein
MEMCLDILVSLISFFWSNCVKNLKKIAHVFFILTMSLDIKYVESFTSEMYAITLICVVSFLVSCDLSNSIFVRNKVVNTPKILL